MAAPDFVHLHVHSEYSLLDGANRIGDLVKACNKDGQRALALTDHGNMFGAIELYQKCRKGDVKPIIGCEVYIAKTSRLQPHNRSDNRYHHLTLLARNEEGYRNLLRMASTAYLEGYSRRPRIDKQVLSEHAAGITCLSGCLAGEINQAFLRGDEQSAERTAAEFRDLFGPEHFWLELQRNGIEIQDKANEAMHRMHQRTGIPIIATNDIHYLREEDCAAQDVLLCINTGAKKADEKRFRFDTDSLFFRTREEMGHIFRDMPESVRATMEVADQVDLDIEFGTYHVPVFHPDDGRSPEQLFDELCEAGLNERYGPGHAGARERLAHERKVIVEMGFISYFLIVWDLIKWARDNGIPVGPGRGSAAGSIVAYALDITRVDPLKYDLLFERFLNSARVSMPDIDIDFCKEGRERVLQYTRERYGAENVAQIVTFGTMASRTVVRDVGRVLDVPLKDVDRIAKKIPAGPGAPSLAKALKTDADLMEIREEYPELEELFEYSVSLEGMARHISTHAAGVVIADRPIVEHVPLCTHGEDIVTQWPAPQLEALGLLKMDYLGLRTLTILARTLKNITKQGGSPPDLENLPAGDPATYRMLVSGDTMGVFQLESEGMRKLLTKLRPDCFEDLIAVLALYRPGPLESGMIDMFIRRKHGEEEVTYPHPSLNPILDDTYGCIVYQEQVMLISNHLAKFSLNEADNLRKAMGKKKPEVMEAFSEQFVAGAFANGCAKDAAQEIWDNIVKFGGYGFNKSHSTAYAMITYQTAYLKANFRTAFLAANLSCEMETSDKVKVLIDDATKTGIEIRVPTISRSGWHFEPEDDAIRFGFGAIKGTGEKAITAMLEVRDKFVSEGRRLDLHELCKEADPHEVPKLCWEAIVKAGAFDEGGHNRGAVLASVDDAMADSVRAAADRKAGQASLFDAPAPSTPGAPAANGASNGHAAGDGIDDSKALNAADTLQLEYDVLGFYLSGHPLEERAGLFSMLSSVSTKELVHRSSGSEVTIAGLVLQLSETLVKSGKYAGRKMARFRLEDLDGGVQTTVFPRTFDENRERIAEGAVLVCRGKVDDRSEEPALILEEAMTVEDALRRFEGALIVNLEPPDRPKLAQLREVFQGHKGRRRLYFQIAGSDGTARRVRVGGDLRVAISAELAEEVDQLLGRGRVHLGRM